MKQYIIISLLVGLSLASCSDMMTTESEMVEFSENNRIGSRQDTVYSVMGIIHKMQKIAGRTVLLGEMRGDLTVVTDKANSDLKALASFAADGGNRYNSISDYYAVINNCNYYLANVDSAAANNGRKVFDAEIAAVHAFRAWTYLQAVLAYGNIPLIVDQVLTEKEAEQQMNKPLAGIAEVCDYFINDLKPYVDTRKPNYGTVGSFDSRKFFIPVRALLGDLCLWAGRYREAASYYHDYFTYNNADITTGTGRVRWNPATKEFNSILDGYSPSLSYISEIASFIPMETEAYYGEVNDLRNIFNSVVAVNKGYFQATPSKAMHALSAAQDYCMIFEVNATQRDTLYAPKTNLPDSRMAGDLRFYANYDRGVVNQQPYSQYSSDRQLIRKVFISYIPTYRNCMLYLRYAEALNRAGYPQSAMAVLKYGMYNEAVMKYVDETERTAAGALIAFDSNTFTSENTQGIHSRGSGDSEANARYVLPQPTAPLATRQDTIDYQIPLVENLIINEMALEGSFEGYRYYDLMRVALRRGDTDYLAKPVSMRDGTQDGALYTLLSDKKNWYLPIR